MTDLFQKQLAAENAMILVMYWFMVGMLPFVILAGGLREPGIWVLYGASLGYFTFTGVRAYRRKWKARFILRIVVPGALLCASLIAIGVLASIRA